MTDDALGLALLVSQGVPVLVSLVEERVSEAGYLTQLGLACIWRILDLQGAIPLNHLCRYPLKPSRWGNYP